MMDFQIPICLICNASLSYENRVFLNCSHNLCHACASMCFLKAAGQKLTLKNIKTKELFIRCQKCQKLSPLETNLAISLFLLAASLDSSKENINKNANESIIDKNKNMSLTFSKNCPEKSTEISELANPFDLKLNNSNCIEDEQINRLCLNHSQNIAEYFCLDCKINPFCNICATKSHKNHLCEKISIQYDNLKKKIQNTNSELIKGGKRLNEIQSMIEDCKKKSIEFTSILKDQIACTFEKFRNLLSQKENELIEFIELKQKNTNLLIENFANQVIEQKNVIERDISIITSNLNCAHKNTLINFYIKYYSNIPQNYSQIISKINSNIPDSETLFCDEYQKILKDKAHKFEEFINTIVLHNSDKTESHLPSDTKINFHNF